MAKAGKTRKHQRRADGLVRYESDRAMSLSEVADKLGVTKNAVAETERLALVKLRRALSRQLSNQIEWMAPRDLVALIFR